jgi:hypothetical protein
MRSRWSFRTNLFSRFQRPFRIVKIPHVILSPKFHLQLKINSGYPSLQSHNEGLQLLPYKIDLLKTKILVNLSKITPLSRITPFYGTNKYIKLCWLSAEGAITISVLTLFSSQFLHTLYVVVKLKHVNSKMVMAPSADNTKHLFH